MAELAQGILVVMGQIEVVEEGEKFKTNYGLLIVFNSAEDIRKAIADGKCQFVFGEENHG